MGHASRHIHAASSDKTSSTDALGVFTFLWAQVMVLQVVKLALPLSGKLTQLDAAALLWPLLMTCSCLAGVLVPRRSWATVNLMVTSVVVLWFTGSQSNHVFMDMVVCLAVLLSFSADRALWQAQAKHSMISFLVTLYFVTALHKINTDWGSVNFSCCTLMLGGIFALAPLRQFLPLIPMDLVPLTATLTELALPLMLLSGRCQRAVTVIGCCFHLAICQMLSPMSVYPFSVLMAPPYIFVIPDRASAMFDRIRPWAWLIVPFYAVVVHLWTPLMAGDLSPGVSLFEYPAYGLWAPGVVWCIFVDIVIIAAALWPEAKEAQAPVPALRPGSPCGLPLAAVVAVFGLSPYLGIRNYPALAMFSNLRTEGGHSNHLLIGDDFDVMGWQRDYVTVHDTDIPALRLMQVDLGPRFTSATKEALQSAGVQGEFWITPPLHAWPYPETREFKSYSMPYLELRRRLAPLRAAQKTLARAQAGAQAGHVHYTRTIARARLGMPWLWRLLGVRNPDADEVRANISYDVMTGGDPEVEEPLPYWVALVARFRSFDVDYSPCRH